MMITLLWPMIATMAPAARPPVARAKTSHMCAAAETRPFDADVGKLLSLLIESVYTDRVRTHTAAPRSLRTRCTERAPNQPTFRATTRAGSRDARAALKRGRRD